MLRHAPRIGFALALFVATGAVVGCDNPAVPDASLNPLPPTAPPPETSAKIVKISGDTQQGAPGDTLQPMVVAVLDRFGKPAVGARVDFSITAGDGLVIVPGTSSPSYTTGVTAVADSTGRASAIWLLGRQGENVVTASVLIDRNVASTKFRAVSTFDSFAGGTFIMEASDKKVTLHEYEENAPLDCVALSGVLDLRYDGSFTHFRSFDCGVRESMDVAESGYYRVANSRITLINTSYESNDGYLIDPVYDSDGVVVQDTIVFTGSGSEWSYTRQR
jgi:hypothetical protein